MKDVLKHNKCMYIIRKQKIIFVTMTMNCNGKLTDLMIV